MINPDPKPIIYRDEKYLDWIRTLPCWVCYQTPSEPHHIRKLKWGAGTSIKPHDYVTVPLCRKCHSQNSIIKDIYDNGEDIVIMLLMKYINKKVKK